MSWLFSRALVEEYSGDTCLDGEQCAPLSVMPTQHKFWRNDKTMEFSSLSQFGLTCAVLTESRGKGLLTSYLVGFRVRTYQSQEKEQELQAKGLVYGGRWQELSEKSNQDMSLLKILQTLEVTALSQSYKGLPKSGMMLRGMCFLQETLEQTTKEKGCGSLLPTPTCHNAKEGGYPSEGRRNTPTLGWNLGGRPNPMYVEWMMGWPLSWTDLKPLEMDKFQEWLHQHSTCSPADRIAA